MNLLLKDPLFFALHIHDWRECCSLKHGQKLDIFETESCNLVKTFRCKFVEGDENKISVLPKSSTGSTDPIVHYGWTSSEGRDDTHYRPSTPWSNTEGGTSPSYNHPLYDSAHLGSLNKCQVYLRLWEQRYFKCKVQCRARWRAPENYEIKIQSEAISC